MAEKYLRIGTGGIREEKEATVVSAGAGDAGEIPALDAGGRLDTSVMPSGIGADTKQVLASEAIGAGNLVNVYDNAGTLNVRKADASNGRVANGFAPSAISSSATGTVQFDGTITGLTGLVGGTRYFLGTAGAATATAPTTAGHILQEVGYGLSTTELSYEPGEPITRA